MGMKVYEEIIKKPNIRNALDDIRLEGGSIPNEVVFIMDDYAEGRLSGDEMVRKVGLCLRDND